MATFNIFNSSEEDVDSESLKPGSLGNIFGITTSEEVLQPRGSPTLTDYFTDIVFQAPAKAVGSIAKGLLQIPFAGYDLAFDTDTLTKLDKFFSEGFFKIPETETGIGDITAVLVQYGIPISKATKIAPFIPGLSKLSQFEKLDDIPSIAGKAGEIAKRAGYFGAIGGLTDFVVSAPGINQTAGEQFGLYEGYAGEDLSGKEKASEVLKSKLKFGAEGATLSGAIPLLPVAGTLGKKYGLEPAGQVLGYVGGNAIRAVDYAVINPVASIISGGKVARIDVPQIVPKLINKIQSGMDIAGENIVKLLPPKDTPFGKLIDNSTAKVKEWLFSNGGVRGDLISIRDQILANGDARAKKAADTFVSMNKTLEDNIMSQFKIAFNKGESKNIIQLEQSKLLDYFNNTGNIKATLRKIREVDPVTKKIKEIVEKDPITGKVLYDYKYSEDEITKKILDTLDPTISKQVKEYAQTLKQQLVDIQGELSPYLTSKELKSGFVDFMGTSFKQSLASFNNARFAFDPLRQEKVMKFFSDELLLSKQDLRSSIVNRQIATKFGSDPIYRAIKRREGDIEEIFNINEKNLTKFNNKYNIDLDIKSVNDFKLKFNSSILNENVFQAIKNKKGSVNEILTVNSKNLNEFNKRNKLNLNIDQVNDFKKSLYQEAEMRTLDIKNAAIRNDLDPRQIFSNISNQLGEGTNIDSLAKLYKKIEQLQGKGKTNLSSIVDYLSVPKGSEITVKGKKIPLPTSDYSSGILGGLIYLNKQNSYRRFFDSLIDMSERTLDPSKKLILRKDEASLKSINTNNLQAIKYRKNEFVDNIFQSDLLKGGYYARPEIVNSLRGVEAVFNGLLDNPIYANIMKLKGVAQIGGTVFSPVAQIRNVTGNAFIALVNGLYGGRTSLSDSFKIITQDIFKGAKINPKLLQDKIDDLITRGVIDQNIQAQELKKLFETANKGKIDLNSFMNNQYVKRAIDIYQGADSGWKIFADSFYQSAFGTALKAENPALLQKGTKAYSDFMREARDWFKTVAKQEFQEINYLTGNLKTPTDIIGEMSSYLVKQTMPTYSQVPKAVRGIRNLPIGNFVSFPAEIIRNSANIISIGARELTSANPLIRQMGARRLMGASAGFGGLGYITKKTAEALTGVGEDKMEAFQRSFSAQYQKNSTLIPVTKPDENGNFKYYNFSYTNPYDSMLRPVNAVLNAFADGSLNKDSVDKILNNALFGNPVTGRSGAIGEFLAPFVDESIGTERLFDITLRDGIKREGGKVFYPQDDANTKISKSIQHVIGGVVPGAVKSAQRIWEGATGKFTDAGTIRDMSTELTAITTGVRIEDAKPLSSMPFIVTSYNKDKQNVDKKFAEIAYRPSATSEQRLDAYKNYLIESYDSQNKMYQTIKDATTIGIDETDVKDIVQSRLNNKKETDSLFNGIYKVPTYNEKAFSSMISRLEKEDPTLAAKLEVQLDTIKGIYKDMNSEFQNFDLGTSKLQFENQLNRILTPGVKEIRRQPNTINILPSSSTPVVPGTPFTYNTPNPSQNVLSINRPQQQEPQTLGERFALLFPRG